MSAAWLNVSAHIDPKYGGIVAVLPAFCDALAAAGAGTISLAGFCHPGEIPTEGGRLIERLPLGKARWLLDRGLRERFAARVRANDGLHIHGLWQEHAAVTGALARAARRPYVVSAHGMLEQWARRQKAWKKAVYRWAVENRNLREACCLHALTAAEARDYREAGFSTPIAIVPNGVRVPASVSPEPFWEQFPSLRGQRVVLYLARLHPKKGLDLLIEAWSRVAPGWPEGHLVLAGPDSEGTRALLEQQVERLGLAPRVTFAGLLTGETKWSALAAADCFVLPSYSEGLSVAVLEAMASGKPVIATAQCNVPEVGAGCGWLIQPHVAALTDALRELRELTPARASLMGEAGRQAVAKRYSWPVVGKQMAAVYDWALGGPTPVGVEVWS